VVEVVVVLRHYSLTILRLQLQPAAAVAEVVHTIVQHNRRTTLYQLVQIKMGQTAPATVAGVAEAAAELLLAWVGRMATTIHLAGMLVMQDLVHQVH
jgi:hypothetical protein